MSLTSQKITILLAVALLLAAACGTKGPGTEVELPKAYMPAARTCPGALPGENIQVTTAIGESNAPVVVWTGESFAVAWWDLRGQFPEVRVIRIDQDGVNRSPAARIPNEKAAKNQSLAWDGKQLNLVFTDGTGVRATTMSTPDEAPKIITKTGEEPAAGPFGAAVWVDRGNLFFRSNAMLEEDDPEGEDLVPTVIASGGIESPQVAYNGKFFAVVWSSSVKGGREILLQRVSVKGMKLGQQVRVSATAGLSRKPVVAWSGEEFGVAWTNAAPGDQNPRDRFRLFFAVIPENGTAPKLTRQLQFQGSADQVALVSTGKEYGLAWVGSKDPRGSAVFLHRISTSGEPKGETTEVTDGVPLTCGRPSIAWDGSGYGVVWHDDRSNTGAEVFFAYVACGEEIPEPVAAPQPEPTPTTEPAPPKPALKEAFAEEKPAEAEPAPEDDPYKDEKPTEEKPTE